MSFDLHQVKLAARGRWRDILTAVAGIPADKLGGGSRQHPCPRCGGNTRFRLLDEEEGAVICNQCFSSRNGDGLAAVGWALGVDFPESLRLVGEYLGVPPEGKPMGKSTASAIDWVQQMALAKNCPRDSLAEYGAESDAGRKCVVFPVYGPDRQQCSEFTVWPHAAKDDKRNKGLLTKGKPSGLFFPFLDQGVHFPQDGEKWLIVEGVKDAAALHGLGYLAAGMNGDSLQQRFVPLFQGCEVVIVPDRKSQAVEKSKETAARLAGVAKSIKIATLPLPLDGDRGDDVRDALRQNDGEKLVRDAIESASDCRGESTSGPRRVDLQEAVSDYVAKTQQGPIPRLTLGIPRLDRMLGGGIKFGSFVVVAALSSHGKTAFNLQVGHHVTRKLREGLIFLSLEMSPDALAERTIQYASEAPQEEWHHLTEQLRHDAETHFAGSAPFVIVEGISTLEEVETEIRQAFENGTRVAMIDYCQLIDAGGSDDTNKAMRRVSARLMKLAKDYDAIVIGMAQLHKRVEQYKPMVPRLTDIEYGTKLGHDADVVIFLVWPHKVDPSQPAGEYRVFIEKNRNGQSKLALDCKFTPSRQRITEMDEVPVGETRAQYEARKEWLEDAFGDWA